MGKLVNLLRPVPDRTIIIIKVLALVPGGPSFITVMIHEYSGRPAEESFVCVYVNWGVRVGIVNWGVGCVAGVGVGVHVGH